MTLPMESLVTSVSTLSRRENRARRSKPLIHRPMEQRRVTHRQKILAVKRPKRMVQRLTA